MKKLPANQLITLEAPTDLILAAQPNPLSITTPQKIQPFINLHFPEAAAIESENGFYRGILTLILGLPEDASRDTITQEVEAVAAHIDHVAEHLQVIKFHEVESIKAQPQPKFTTCELAWELQLFRGMAALLLNLPEDGDKTEFTAAARCLLKAIENAGDPLPLSAAWSSFYRSDQSRTRLGLTHSQWLTLDAARNPLSAADRSVCNQLGLSSEGFQTPDLEALSASFLSKDADEVRKQLGLTVGDWLKP